MYLKLYRLQPSVWKRTKGDASAVQNKVIDHLKRVFVGVVVVVFSCGCRFLLEVY